MKKIVLSVALLASGGMLYSMTTPWLTQPHFDQTNSGQGWSSHSKNAAFGGRLIALKNQFRHANLTVDQLKELRDAANVLAGEAQVTSAGVYSDAADLARRVSEEIQKRESPVVPLPIEPVALPQ